MIFRALYKNKVRRLFGEFVPDAALEQIVGDLSEWQALRGLLPSGGSREEAIIEVQRRIQRALAARNGAK